MSSSDGNSNTTITPPNLYIIYNAKSTIYGKLNYVYRKATCPDSESNPACAACELTHGPSIRLSESPKWIETKKRIHNANVLQVHQDEMPAPLQGWMKSRSVSTPAVVVERGDSARMGNKDHNNFNTNDDTVFKVLLTAEDLALVRLDHEQFLTQLMKRARQEGIAGIVVDSVRL